MFTRIYSLLSSLVPDALVHGTYKTPPGHTFHGPADDFAPRSLASQRWENAYHDLKKERDRLQKEVEVLTSIIAGSPQRYGGDNHSSRPKPRLSHRAITQRGGTP